MVLFFTPDCHAFYSIMPLGNESLQILQLMLYFNANSCNNATVQVCFNGVSSVLSIPILIRFLHSKQIKV